VKYDVPQAFGDLERGSSVSFKESPAHSFAFTLPVGGLVARNAPFTLGRRPHHSLHGPIFQAHQISGTKNAGIAKTAAYVYLALSIDLPALAHDPKNFSRTPTASTIGPKNSLRPTETPAATPTRRVLGRAYCPFDSYHSEQLSRR